MIILICLDQNEPNSPNMNKVNFDKLTYKRKFNLENSFNAQFDEKA